MTINEAVETLFAGEPDDEADAVLARRGGAAARAILRRLEGSPLLSQAMNEGGSINFRRFERIIKALAATRSEAARQQLISLLRSPREDVRRLAARLFAAQGDEAAVKFAQRVIRDGDDDVLFAAAINGLVDAADAGLLAPGARRKLFAVVSRYVVGAAKPPPQGWLLLMPWPEVLVALDRARAAEVLRSPKCLRQGNPELDEVFGAINRYGVPVDTAKVRKLLFRLSRQPVKHRRALTEGCELLAKRGGQCADIVEAHLLEADDLSTRLSAFYILCLTRGWGWLEYQPRSRRRRSDAEKQVAAVWEMLGEMTGDGVEHWVENDEPRKWRDAMGGLKLLGAKRALAAVERLSAAVRADRPPASRSEPDDKIVDKVEDVLFDDKENVPKRMWQYLSQHRGGEA